jgi:hypothetical protein
MHAEAFERLIGLLDMPWWRQWRLNGGHNTQPESPLLPPTLGLPGSDWARAGLPGHLPFSLCQSVLIESF